MVTRGGRGRGRVKWKVPDHHVVAAHWPNNIKNYNQLLDVNN
jgi:hypothetical protein